MLKKLLLKLRLLVMVSVEKLLMLMVSSCDAWMFSGSFIAAGVGVGTVVGLVS